MTLEQWQAVIDVNLTGVFLCGREAATKMIEAGKPGVITFTLTPTTPGETFFVLAEIDGDHLRNWELTGVAEK